MGSETNWIKFYSTYFKLKYLLDKIKIYGALLVKMLGSIFNIKDLHIPKQRIHNIVIFYSKNVY